MIQVNTFLSLVPKHLPKRRESGDIRPIPQASLMLITFWGEFPSANHIAENTICGCKSGNPWLLQHHDSNFLALKKLAISSQLWWSPRYQPNTIVDHTVSYCFVFLGQWNMQTPSDLATLASFLGCVRGETLLSHSLGTRLLLHVLYTV